MRVMQSFPELRETTNPYLHQLWQSVPAPAELRTFSWTDAVKGRFEVLHVHWPELLVRSAKRRATGVKYLLLLAVLVRIRTSRRVLVRTLHNVTPHESGSALERAVLRLLDRWTSVFVILVPSTPLPDPRDLHVVIPLGDYRVWFSGYEVPPARPGRLGHVGLIRRYKGVDQLIDAFGSLKDPDAELRIVGSVRDSELEAMIRSADARDPRISARLEFVDDQDLVTEIGHSAVVVLPYKDMLNSAAALLALSLGRPVLVPDNEVTRALADEVGHEWVMRFQGQLGADDLGRSLTSAADVDRSELPDLGHRDWASIGEQHLRAYELALSTKSRPSSSQLSATTR